MLVCEARPDDGGEAGAFLSLASHGVRALRALGAEDAVAAVSDPVTTLRLLDEAGATVGTRPLSTPDAPAYRLVARGALALAALATARGAGIRYGAGITDAAPDGDGVTVALADGSEVHGSLLVGADGIGSTARALVDPASPPPRPVGQRVYYGMTPVRLLGRPGDFTAQRTPAGSFGAFARADDTWWYVRRHVDDPTLPADPDPRAALLDCLAPDGPPARAVREAASIAAVDAHDLPYVGRWYRDRMVVVGDAAHAASPTTGQGATMALEDVVVLAKALRDHGDVDDAAAAYERARRGRTQATVLASAATSRPDRPVEGAVPGEQLPDDVLSAQLDWDTPLI